MTAAETRTSMPKNNNHGSEARTARGNTPLIGCLAAVCIFSVLINTASASEPQARPGMQAFELQSEPVLDGEVLADAAWQGVAPATGFTQVQPDEGLPATQKTEVFIGFLDDALYIGMVAYDDDPDGIIVTDARRDSHLHDTDSFQVIIDGLLDRQNGFVFGTNPLGREYDAQVVKEGAGGAGTIRGST